MPSFPKSIDECTSSLWIPALGACIWAAGVALAQPTATVIIFLLAPLVIVPLGLRLADHSKNGPLSPEMKSLQLITLPAAVLVALSFSTQRGGFSALLTIPWFLFTVAVAVLGLIRLLSRRSLTDPAIAVDVGMVFLAIGGLWLTVSRANFSPRFESPVVMNTAIHFHYAGFALAMISGIAARRTSKSWLLPVVAVLAVPLAALGNILEGEVAWTSATLMAVVGLAVASSLVELAKSETGAARKLLMISALYLGGTVLFALAHAWLVRLGVQGATVQRIIRWYVELSGLGFGLVGLTGLIGLNLSKEQASLDDREARIHIGPPSIGRLEELRVVASRQEPTNEPGLLERPLDDGFRTDVWSADGPDFENSCEALYTWAGHEAAGIILQPTSPRIAEGLTLSLAVPVGPIFFSGTCRIVQIINETDRYGFVYSTLPHHAESGEESFVVQQNEDGTATVTVTSIWRPASVAASVCRPLTRYLQGRTVQRYVDGIAEAEVATVGARLLSVIDDVDHRDFPMSRAALRAPGVDAAMDRLAKAEATEQAAEQGENSTAASLLASFQSVDLPDQIDPPGQKEHVGQIGQIGQIGSVVDVPSPAAHPASPPPSPPAPPEVPLVSAKDLLAGDFPQIEGLPPMLLDDT